MLGRLRLFALLGSRLLPVVGPLLIERDLLRSALAAAALENEVLRSAAKCERGPVWL